jgi:hypothetical protein
MKLFKQDRLYGQVDLSKVTPDGLKATIRVSGMRGTEKEATFTPAFRVPDRKAEGTQSGEATPDPGAVKTAAIPTVGSGCAMAKGAGRGSCCRGKAKADASSGSATGCEMKHGAEAGSTNRDTSSPGH